jgi:hypothetical protein
LLRINRLAPIRCSIHSFIPSKPWSSPTWGTAQSQVVPGTLVGRRQFGMIRISGPGDDRTIEPESYDQTGKLIWRHALRASDCVPVVVRPHVRQFQLSGAALRLASEWG